MATFGIGAYGAALYGSGEPTLGQTGYGSGIYGAGLYGYEAMTVGGLDMFSRTVMDEAGITQVHQLSGLAMFSRTIMGSGAVDVHVVLQGSGMFSRTIMGTGSLVETVDLTAAGGMFSRTVMDSGDIVVVTGTSLAGLPMLSRTVMDDVLLTQDHALASTDMFSRTVMDIGDLNVIVPMLRIKPGTLELFGPAAIPDEMPWKILWPAPGWPGTILVSESGVVTYKETPTTQEIAQSKYVLRGGYANKVQPDSELHEILARAGYEFEEV